MSNILNKVTGNTLILEILEQLKNQQISTSNAFEKIRQILKINLEYFGAKKNCHNSC